MEDTLSYLEKYQEEGFTKSMNLTKSVALEMYVKSIFLTKSRVIIKKHFGEIEEHENYSPEDCC